jgi:hypothetical protein
MMYQMQLSQEECTKEQPAASCRHPLQPDQMTHPDIGCNQLLTSQVTGHGPGHGTAGTPQGRTLRRRQRVFTQTAE